MVKRLPHEHTITTNDPEFHIKISGSIFPDTYTVFLSQGVDVIAIPEEIIDVVINHISSFKRNTGVEQ